MLAAQPTDCPDILPIRQQLREVVKDMGSYTRIPKSWRRWLSFELQAFYAFLIEHASYHVPEDGIQNHEGWFWVPFDKFCLANGCMNRRTAARKWISLLKKLEAKNAIRIRLESIRGKEGGKRYWILIKNLGEPDYD